MARTVLGNAAFNSADVSNTTSSDNPPSNPQPGDIWYDTNDGGTFIYYEDADSSQWVQIIGQAGADAVLGDYSINELNDVDTASSGHIPSDGQALVWDSGMSHWMPGNSGVTVYSTAADLPLSGVTEGSLALVDSTDRLYIWSDLGWYNIALVNTTPTFTTSPNSSYDLDSNGTATVITIVAEDPEGVPITYAATTSGLTNQATITQGTGANTNVFTITPSTNTANGGTFTVTFTATDGVNTATTGASTFTLTFGDNEFASVALLINGDVTTSTNNSSFGTDSSANGHAVVTTGTPAAGLFGPYGDNWSVYFDGSNDYLQVPANTDYQFGTSDFTIEAWIFTDGSDFLNIWQNCPFNTSANTDDYFFGVNSNGQLVFSRHGGFAQVNSSNGAVTFNEWHHIAVTRTSSVMTLWLDGSSVGTSTDTNLISYNINQNVAHTIGWRVTPNYGEGYVSNLRVLNGTALYSSSFTPSSSNLTAITNTVFLGLQSNNFKDNSTNNAVITPGGGPKVTAFSPFKTGTTKTFANTGGSIYLDGSSVSYADIGDAGDFTFGTADFTIDCWVYISDPTQNFNIFNIGPASTGSLGFYWLRNSHGTNPQKFSLIRYGDSGTFSATVYPYQWVHIRGVRASGTAKIFINGIESGSASMGSVTANVQAEIGNRVWQGAGATSDASGYIADLRVEVGTATSTASFTPPTSQVTTTANTDLLLNFDNAAIYDFSGNNNLKTVGNAGLSFTSKYGTGSLEFDGSGDYLTIPSTQDVALGSGDFTIECWANFSVVGGGNGQGLFQLSNGYLNSQDGRGPAIGINNQNGQWYIYYGAGTNLNTSLGSSPSANTWYHVAFVRTSGVIKIFIDGTQIGSDISYSGNYTDTYLTVGGWYSSSYLLNGYLDDLRITKGVARYTSSFTPPSAIDLSSDTHAENVVLHLDGNGTDGAANNTFTDSSTNDFTITETGRVVQGVFSPYGDNWSNSFDGNSDYISIADSADFDLGTGDFTMEAWVYPKAFTGNYNQNNIISAHEGTDNTAYSFAVYSDGTLQLYGGGGNNDFSTSTVSLNEWTHVMVTRYSGTVRFFINGTLDASTYTRTGNYNCTTQGLAIGKQPIDNGGAGATRYWNGWLSNVRMVKGTALQTSSFTPSTSPLTNVTNTVLLACQSNRFIDNSSSSHTLTPAGTASVTRFSPFESNKPYDITTDGGSGYFDLANTAYLSFSGGEPSVSDITISGWVYPKTMAPQSGNAYPRVFAAGGFLIYVRDDDIRIYNGSERVQAPINNNEWTYFAAQRSSNTWTLYINGVSKGTASDSSNIALNSTNYIGSNGANNYFTGYIADLRITTSGSTSTAVPTSPVTAVTNTELLLNFQDAAIKDNAGLNNLDTVANADIKATVSGKYSTRALEFDGTSDYIRVPHSEELNFGTGDFTVEMWVSLITGTQDNDGIIAKGATGTGWQLIWNNTNEILFIRTSGNASSPQMSTGSNTVNKDGTWYHVAITRSGSTVRLFLNGTQVDTYTDSTSWNTTQSLDIGANRSANNLMAGYIDDLRITKGVARYTANFTAPTEALYTQ